MHLRISILFGLWATCAFSTPEPFGLSALIARCDEGQASLYRPFIGRTSTELAIESLPKRYRHPRFLELAYDPDRKLISTMTVREAMVAIEAVYRSVIHGPIYRAPAGAGLDFFDRDLIPIDVKSPVSPSAAELWKIDVSKIVKSVQTKLHAHRDRPVRILLDTTFLNTPDRLSLIEALNEVTTSEERSQISEITLRF